jgi:hypothetical protein
MSRIIKMTSAICAQVPRFQSSRTEDFDKSPSVKDEARYLLDDMGEIEAEGERPIFKWTRTDCDDDAYTIEYYDLSSLSAEEHEELFGAALRFVKPIAQQISSEWIQVIPESKVHPKCKSGIISLSKDLVQQTIDSLTHEEIEFTQKMYL